MVSLTKIDARLSRLLVAINCRMESQKRQPLCPISSRIFDKQSLQETQTPHRVSGTLRGEGDVNGLGISTQESNRVKLRFNDSCQLSN